MIVVGQEKNIIVNFDNVMTIRVERLNNYAIFVFDNYRNAYNIGNFATEERAKEVLQDIIYTYQKQNDDFYYEDSKLTNTKIYMGYTKQHKDNTYYMPEK